MSRFENSYLAESVGYNNGHANGMADGVLAGRKHGYTEGWNAATIHANGVIAQRDAEIERIYGANQRLGAENAELKQMLQLQQEQAQALRAQYEDMFKAFLGAASIATPAMKIIAKMPIAEKNAFVFQYGDMAIELQSQDYVNKNHYPHNQPMIKKYMPAASQVINQAIKDINVSNSKENTAVPA